MKLQQNATVYNFTPSLAVRFLTKLVNTNENECSVIENGSRPKIITNQARKQEMKWGGCKKVENVFFVKKWTFPQRWVRYVQYQYFFNLHFTYLGGAYAPNALPCLRACK